MSTSKITAGLCVNCSHAPTCTLARESTGPVLHCNEYECITPQRPPAKHKKRPHKAIDNHSDNCLGLCVNCDNRETCALPKPDGGVWRCNEYQ